MAALHRHPLLVTKSNYRQEHATIHAIYFVLCNGEITLWQVKWPQNTYVTGLLCGDKAGGQLPR